jgi:hypothetical protein
LGPELPSALLFPGEGPVLTHEEVRGILEQLSPSGSDSYSGGSYAKQGLGEFRYRKDPYDFDVFVFSADGRVHIELRLPSGGNERG